MRRPAAAPLSLILALVLLAVVTGLSACTPGAHQETGPKIVIAPHVARSTVIAVIPDGEPSPVVTELVTATARPARTSTSCRPPGQPGCWPPPCPPPRSGL